MLSRAATNAYSWWWASHIRTKQSKWLDNDLQEMEERVKAMIKLIDEDADSFAKKAEMYFRRRPELISAVEDAYRAYKSLADRYDRISGELHKANHAIATAFPDQVPSLEDYDGDESANVSLSAIVDSSKLPNQPPDTAKLPKPPPELPRPSSRHRRAEVQQPAAPKKPRHRRLGSHITAEQAKEEIDRLHKRILALQTEKEFFKGSYEKGLAKYWDLDKQITDLHEEISELQDEFADGSVIEDNEARALMAATALKSCEDSLVSLHEQQKQSIQDARLESERIVAAKSKLSALKGEESDNMSDKDSMSSCSIEEEYENLRHERLELQSICSKVKDMFQMSSETTITELAEKIDGLVEKIISLEITVSSQTAQILTLRKENDELHSFLHKVEEEKKDANVDPNNLNDRLTQVEQQLARIVEIERNVQNERGAVKSHFAEACNSLNDLSEQLQAPIPENKEEENKGKKNQEEEENSSTVKASDSSGESGESKSQPDGQSQLLIDGENSVIFEQYSSIIQSYKETRKMLTEMERRNQECHSETMQQIQELKCANAIKDEEIRNLRRKLFSAESLRGTPRTPDVSKDPPPNANDAQKAAELIEVTLGQEIEPSDFLAEEEVKICTLDQMLTPSPLEEKFRADIDTLLDENLDFWLRFSSSYHRIQQFQSKFKELQAEAEKEIEYKNSLDCCSPEPEDKPVVSPPVDKKLREFNTELQVWLEHTGLLQGELRSRYSSLCNIQEEIAKLSKSEEGEEAQLTPYQAAKFQGEVINMQQENNKVGKELQTGLDHVKGIQTEVGKTIDNLVEKFDLVSSKTPRHGQDYNQFRHLSTKSKVPLKTFLFASKAKKASLFSCMTPVYHRHHSHSRREPR